MAETKAPTTPEVKAKPCNSCPKPKPEEEEIERIYTNEKGDTTVYRKLANGRTEIFTTHADNTFEHELTDPKRGVMERTVKGTDGVQRSSTVSMWDNSTLRTSTTYPGGVEQRSEISTGSGFDRRETVTTFPDGQRTIVNSESQSGLLTTSGTTQTRTLDASGRVTSDTTRVDSRFSFFGAGSATGSVSYGSTVGASLGASVVTGQEAGVGAFVQTESGGRAIGAGVNLTTSAGNGSLATTYDPVTRVQNNTASLELGRDIGRVPATFGFNGGYSTGPSGTVLGSGLEVYGAGPGGFGRQSFGTPPSNVTLDNAAADIAKSMRGPSHY